MSRFWSSLTHDLKPYVPGEQPRIAELVKLNTNESPFGPSPRALEAIRAEAADTLRLYPDPQASALRAALATYHQVRPEQVFVGNGSDEVLAHAFAALLKHDAPLLFPDITYSFYPVYCRLFGIAYEAVPLDQAMQIRVADYRRPAGAIIIPNPNAPTGVALSRAEIATLLEEHPDAPVVIDEAYVDFGAETAIPLVASHPNLLVVQTMSKSRALAGLRVGYAIGDADLIEALTRVKDSFNSYPLGRPAQAGAIAALEDEAYFQQSRARVIEGRERLNRGLVGLGFEVLPSSANFVFARHPAHEGAALAAALRQRAVIVRHFSAPRISDYLRITVGTDGQIDRLLSALSEILGSRSPDERSDIRDHSDTAPDIAALIRATRYAHPRAHPLLHDVEFDLGNTLPHHSQRVGRGIGDVDDTALNIGTAVVDPHRHRAAAGDVRHAQLGAERQRRMGGGHFERVELLAARRLRSLGVVARNPMRSRFDVARIPARRGRRVPSHGGHAPLHHGRCRLIVAQRRLPDGAKFGFLGNDRRLRAGRKRCGCERDSQQPYEFPCTHGRNQRRFKLSTASPDVNARSTGAANGRHVAIPRSRPSPSRKPTRGNGVPESGRKRGRMRSGAVSPAQFRSSVVIASQLAGWRPD